MGRQTEGRWRLGTTDMLLSGRELMLMAMAYRRENGWVHCVTLLLFAVFVWGIVRHIEAANGCTAVAWLLGAHIMSVSIFRDLGACRLFSLDRGGVDMSFYSGVQVVAVVQGRTLARGVVRGTAHPGCKQAPAALVFACCCNTCLFPGFHYGHWDSGFLNLTNYFKEVLLEVYWLPACS